jgi:hypothetical protein
VPSGTSWRKLLEAFHGGDYTTLGEILQLVRYDPIPAAQARCDVWHAIRPANAAVSRHRLKAGTLLEECGA